MVRVRFAPSPTGFLHLGGLRTALFNALFARKHGGQFILRIEDTDQERLVPGAAEALQDALEWCGIVPDEGPTAGGPSGPYVQSQRLSLYREHADQLMASGAAYHCFCSEERLETLRRLALRTHRLTAYDGACRNLSADVVQQRLEDGAPYTVRLRVPTSEGATVVHDEVYGAVSFRNDAIDDQVLLKTSGFPTYHLANVVDDRLMGITHVMRGEEWLASTAKHLHLYRAFGWDPPAFAHIPLLVNTDRSKLSKRQGDLRVEALRAAGVLPSALINFVAFLGWSSPNLQAELYRNVDDIAADFSLESVTRAPAAVDMRKLKHLNKMHQAWLERDSPALHAVTDALYQRMLHRYGTRGGGTQGSPHDVSVDGGDDHDDRAGDGDSSSGSEGGDSSREVGTSPDDSGKVRQTTAVAHADTLTREYLTRVLLASIGSFDMMGEALDCEYFWIEPDWSGPEAASAAKRLSAAGRFAVLPAIIEAFEKIPPGEETFTTSALREALEHAASVAGCKPPSLQPLLRYCVTGQRSGPPVLNVLEVIGKERGLARLRAAPTTPPG